MDAEPEAATEEAAAAAPMSAKPWQDKLKCYRDSVEDKWGPQRENLDKLYSRNERTDAGDREYAIFWANIEVLKPAVYARPPVPVVAPRFKQSNPIASAASEILERSLITTFEQSDIDGCMREVRDEFLRYARGTAWVRLEAETTPRVVFDFVTACDFAHDPARTWREVKWVARRAWLSREKGEARFGEQFREVPCKKRDESSAIPSKDDEAAVWEIWDRESGQVYWVNEEYANILDTQPPPLSLSDFWPCPKPAYGTLVPGKLQPVPDIRQYKDQIEEINEYTARISALSENLRLKGFYPAGNGEASDALETALKSLDNRATLVPVSSWAAFGGVAPKDMIVWLPVDQVLVTIKGLVELRRVVIDDVYQITGISDIVRGQTEASETATAQQIKSQWGSIRIRNRQGELSRFARDFARIAGEIIAENFDNATILKMAQVQDQAAQQPQQPGMAPQPSPVEMALMLLRDDQARGFVIEIETDSTIQPDEDADKQRRIEFTTAIGGLLNQALPAVQAAPMLGQFVGEVLKFVAQGFRAGRPLEGAIDQFTQMLGQMAQQPQQGDPAAAAKAKEAEVKLKGTEAQTQAKVIGAQADMAKTQMDMQASAQNHQQNMQMMAIQQAMPQPERPN